MCLWECNVFSLPCWLGAHGGRQDALGLSVKLEAVLCFVSWLLNCRVTLCRSRFIKDVIVVILRKIHKSNKSKCDHITAFLTNWQIYVYKVRVRRWQQEQEQQTLKAWMRSSLRQLWVITTLLCRHAPVQISIKLRSSASPYNKHSCNEWQGFNLGTWC